MPRKKLLPRAKTNLINLLNLIHGMSPKSRAHEAITVNYLETRAYVLAERYRDLKWRELVENIRQLNMRPLEALKELNISDEIMDYPTSPLGLYIYRKTGRPLTSGFIGEAAQLLNISWDEARELMEANSKVVDSMMVSVDDVDEWLRRLEEKLQAEL
jgi:hypothetical protein